MRQPLCSTVTENGSQPPVIAGSGWPTGPGCMMKLKLLVKACGEHDCCIHSYFTYLH